MLIADAVDQYKLKLVDFTPYYQCANPMDLTGSGGCGVMA